MTRISALVAILAVAPLASAATFTPVATLTPALTPPTADISPTAMPSPSASSDGSPTLAASPTPTAPRRSPLPSQSPRTAVRVAPTPVETPDLRDDAAEDDGEGDATSVRAAPSPLALPTAVPVDPVRAFRTPDRAAPPAFVAPVVEPPASADDGQPDPSATEVMPPPDEPYIATITFRATASTDIDGFELVIIYPRDAGEFVGDRNGVDCRKTGDATMFADDHEDGMLRLLVGSSRPLVFPFEVVCHFTVAPNETLPARVIAVNVADVTIGREPVEPSALSVSVSAH